MKITSHADPGVTRLALTGDLDMATADLLIRQVTDALAGHPTRSLVIDAADLVFCDSSGVHALVSARREAHRHGSTFQLTNPHGITRRTLQITGVLDVLTTTA
jgi:anti-sigma B factor antagonist